MTTKALSFLWSFCKVTLGIYFGLLALMYVVQRSLIYHPQSAPSLAQIAQYAPTAEPVQVITSDGLVLESLFIPPKDLKKPIILAFHGNASLSLWMASSLNGVADKTGVGILAAEYRGYGGNKGQPSEAGLLLDAEGHSAWLLKNYPDNPLVVYGQSLGSGVAVDLARREPRTAGLILEVPFDSLVDVTGHIYPFVPYPELLLKDQFRSIDKISQVTAPVFVMVAKKDDVVGPDGGRRLFAAAREPKILWEANDAKHMNIFDHGAEEEIITFLSHHMQVSLMVSSTIYIGLASGRTSIPFDVTLAVTESAREKGLMGVTHLEEGKGMLFVFPEPQEAGFWMRGTFIPLDMIFITADGVVADIHAEAIPHDETPIRSKVPVKYALEIGGGLAKKHGISLGDRVILPESAKVLETK